MEFLSKLNPEQREAVLHRDGPLLILAGAGSGKTRVITYRIAHLIGDGHAAPDHVLAVTFTNKAAQEMRERVETLIGNDAQGVWLSTFHSLCARLLRREAPKIGLSRDFVIYDSSDQASVVKQALKELNIDDKFVPPRMALSRISHAKNRMEGPDSLRGTWDVRGEHVAKIYEKYLLALKDANALDFDDLLLKTVELFETSEQVRGFYAQKFRYVMVDEYQDTNRPQYLLIRRLAELHRNLAVVGRSGPVDLQVARRGPEEHPRLRERLPGGGHGAARAELSLHAGDPRRGDGGHQPEPQPQGEAALDRPAGGREDRLLPRQRRARRGGLHHADDQGAPPGGRPRADGGALPHQRAVTRHRRLADARGDPVQDHRRRPLLRAQGDQGRARLPQTDHQPARRRQPAPRHQRAGPRDRQGGHGLAPGHRSRGGRGRRAAPARGRPSGSEFGAVPLGEGDRMPSTTRS